MILILLLNEVCTEFTYKIKSIKAKKYDHKYVII